MYFRSKQRFFIHSWENAYKGKRKKWIKWTIHAISRPPWDIAACEGEIRRLESVIRSNKDTTNDVARLYRRSILSRLIFKLIPRKFQDPCGHERFVESGYTDTDNRHPWNRILSVIYRLWMEDDLKPRELRVVLFGDRVWKKMELDEIDGENGDIVACS